MFPNKLMSSHGQNLQRALCDESDLDMRVICVDFSFYLIAIFFSFPIQILITGAFFYSIHGKHPEVIGICAESSHGLLEGDFNFETKAVDFDYFDGVQREVGAHEYRATPGGMHDKHKAYSFPDGPPDEIQGAV